MSRTDANGATWVQLATEADFLPRAGDARGPQLGPGASYDADRHVLELTPELPRRRRRTPAGLAVDPAGDVYLVADGRLQVERCDGSRVPLPCEPGLLREPLGLALDRRGLLYVADRAARCVVVLQPDDGRVEARLHAPGLREPVDVAIAPSGDVFVADRGGGDVLGRQGGQIWRFDPRFEPRASWVPDDGATPARPVRPRPVAVLWDAGEVLVADEAHPRLLAFDRDGDPRPEREYRVTGALARARFGAGAPDASWYARAGLAAVHAAVRVLRLSADGRYGSAGEWRSAVLDAGVPGTTWHRIDLDVDLPPGTGLAVASASAGAPGDLDDPAWDILRDRDGNELRFSGTPAAFAPPFAYDAPSTAARVREQLVQSPPGRFLRLRVSLRGDGAQTPALRSMRIYHPRNSFREELPAAFSADAAARAFLDGYLALFERVLTRIEHDRDGFYERLRPAAAPPEVLTWLGALLDLSFDPSWPLARRRALVAEAPELYRRRGTPAGIARHVEVYAGVRPEITEAFRFRPARAARAGTAIVGQTLAVGLGPAGAGPPDEELLRAYAHRFTVHLPVGDDCERDRLAAAVDRIVSVSKPAHTAHTLELVAAGARVGVQSTVGIDLVPGARPTAGTRLAPGAGAPVLGQDTVLGPRRPRPRPPDPAF